jgi:flagellar biosynthetic protein FliR
MDLVLTQSLLESWLFVFARLLGWASVDPLMGRLPWSLRLFVAGALAWAWVPGLPAAQIEPATTAGLISLSLSFLTGTVMGFAARLLVAVAETVLPMLGLTASLGLSQAAPEQKGGLEPVLQGLAWWLALLAFFSANGHLLVVQAINASFAAVPPTGLPGAASARELAEAGGTLLAAALQLGLPLLVLVLLAHFAFAVMSRTLPGVDGFSVGLTLGVFTLLGGLALTVPLLVSGLTGLFLRTLPQLIP